MILEDIHSPRDLRSLPADQLPQLCQELRQFLLEMRDLVDPAAEIGLGDLPFKGVNVSYDQFDLKKVERDTGYVNQIPFAQGIKMTAYYIREEA